MPVQAPGMQRNRTQDVVWQDFARQGIKSRSPIFTRCNHEREKRAMAPSAALETIAALPALDELCSNTLRFLAVDMVQKANSGHPGLPMG